MGRLNFNSGETQEIAEETVLYPIPSSDTAIVGHLPIHSRIMVRPGDRIDFIGTSEKNNTVEARIQLVEENNKVVLPPLVFTREELKRVFVR